MQKLFIFGCTKVSRIFNSPIVSKILDAVAMVSVILGVIFLFVVADYYWQGEML